MNIIGIVGRAGSGKSTLAKGLLAALPRSVPVSLATPFKLEGVALDGLPVEEVFGPRAKSPETRKRLQQRGTERGRAVHGDDVWLRHADADLYRLDQYGMLTAVIDDVRFVNEAEWVRARGGTLIKLVGRNAPMSVENANHPSETSIDGIEGDLTLDTRSLSPDACVTLAYGFLLGRSTRTPRIEPEPANPDNAAAENAAVEGGE